MFGNIKPERSYDLSVTHDNGAQQIVLQFDKEPDEWVMAVIHAAGFDSAKSGRVYRAHYDKELFYWAQKLKDGLANTQFPTHPPFPYKPAYPATLDSLNSYKFAFITVTYDDNGVHRLTWFLLFDTSKRRVDAISKLTTRIIWGDHYIKHTYEVGRRIKEARMLFNMAMNLTTWPHDQFTIDQYLKLFAPVESGALASVGLNNSVEQNPSQENPQPPIPSDTNPNEQNSSGENSVDQNSDPREPDDQSNLAHDDAGETVSQEQNAEGQNSSDQDSSEQNSEEDELKRENSIGDENGVGSPNGLKFHIGEYAEFGDPDSVEEIPVEFFYYLDEYFASAPDSDALSDHEKQDHVRELTFEYMPILTNDWKKVWARYMDYKAGKVGPALDHSEQTESAADPPGEGHFSEDDSDEEFDADWPDTTPEPVSGAEVETIDTSKIPDSISDNSIPVKSIVLQMYENYPSFSTWIEANEFLAGLPTEDKKGEIKYRVNWSDGSNFTGTIQADDFGRSDVAEECLLGCRARKTVWFELFKVQGRLAWGDEGPNDEWVEIIEDWLRHLDFGLNSSEMAQIDIRMKHRIPVKSVKVNVDLGLFSESKLFLSWQKFMEASDRLGKAHEVLGIADEIVIELHWHDGKEVLLNLTPFEIPESINEGTWEMWLAPHFPDQSLFDYQTNDYQALLRKDEINTSVEPINGYYRLLKSAYWSAKGKNKDQAIVVDGASFHYPTLYIILKELFDSESLSKAQAIAQVVDQNFESRVRLSEHLRNELDSESSDQEVKWALSRFVFGVVEELREKENEAGPLLSYLIDQLAASGGTLVDLPPNIERDEHQPVVDANSKSRVQQDVSPRKQLDKKSQERLDLNKEIEAFLDERDDPTLPFTERELEYIEQYSGYGGLASVDMIDAGLLYEYYTPREIVEKMWGLAYHFGYRGGDVLEPAVGTGRFLKYAPPGSRIVAFETSKYSARICQLLYPYADVRNVPFESVFFSGNVHLKGESRLEPFDLVIGNPPYGNFEGKYAGMAEKRYTKARGYDQYFITRGLDLLKPGGLLVFIVPHGFLDSGKAYNVVKERIAQKAKIMDAYRAPNRVFGTTEVGTDIVVFKRRSDGQENSE